MNKLIKVIATDLGIPRFTGETNEHFIYRVCYSAFGNWCLKLGENVDSIDNGCTKHNITIILNELFKEYSNNYPFLEEYFCNKNGDNFAVLIRRIYEETGYYLISETNRVCISNRGKTIKIGEQNLYFGLPKLFNCMNGLGIFTKQKGIEFTYKKAFLRDNLTPEEYVQSKYDKLFFDEVDFENMQFFNPYSNYSLSSSWDNKLISTYSVARDENNSYFRIIHNDNIMLATLEPTKINDDSLTSFEYRRLYYALKKYCSNPSKAKIVKIDELYSKLFISSYLPNREYYFLMLCCWPLNGIFNRTQFLIKNELINDIKQVLSELGIDIIGD